MLRNIGQCNGNISNSSFENGKGIRYRSFGSSTGVFGGGQDTKQTFKVGMSGKKDMPGRKFVVIKMAQGW